MKKLILLFLLCSYCLCYSQKLPRIDLLNTTAISGTAPVGTTIRIDTNNDGNYADASVTVDATGAFHHVFGTALTAGSIIGIKSSVIKGKSIKETKPMFLVIQVPPSTATSMAVAYLDNKNLSLANTILIYKTTISNTNFSIPIARFNLSKNASNNALGNVTLFNSIGAGVGISWGRMEITRDHQGQITNEEYSNTVGFHLGALFSSGTGEDTKNVFAPTLNLVLLDFQIGVGYELGTIEDNQQRFFFTISYAIPLYKLVRKGYRIWKIDPYPIASRKGSNLN